MWGREIMDVIVAGRDQVETAVGIKFSGRLCVKLQAQADTLCRGARARPRDRMLVWVDADDLAERLCNRDADSADCGRAELSASNRRSEAAERKALRIAGIEQLGTPLVPTGQARRSP